MKDYDSGQVMEALADLRNQIKEIRKLLSPSGGRETPAGEIYSVGNGEYKVELTPNEMDALLFSPPRQDNGKIPEKNDGDDIGEIRDELKALKEQHESDYRDLKKYIIALSEMWGRLELEVTKLKKSP